MSTVNVPCAEGVTRGEAFQPCDKPAVAMRLDPEEKKPYPVCLRHCRGDMVPLNEVKAQAVAEWQKQHWAEFNKSLALDPYRQGYEDILQSPPLFPEHVGETE